MKVLSSTCLPLALTPSLSLILVSCGKKDEPSPTRTSSPQAEAFGGVALSCGESGQQKTQKVGFKQQEECATEAASQRQRFQFKDSQIDEVEMRVDCAQMVVQVSKRGESFNSRQFPIQENGQVSGQVDVTQVAASDGRGNESCSVDYEMQFNGAVECEQSVKKVSLDSRITFKGERQQDDENEGELEVDNDAQLNNRANRAGGACEVVDPCPLEGETIELRC